MQSQSKRKSKQRRRRRNMTKSKSRSSKNYVFKYSPVPPKRSVLYGGESAYGAVAFPASVTNSSPGNYLPHNFYAGDPNYLAVASRNIPMNGGIRRRSRKHPKKQKGGDILSSMSSLATNVFASQPQMINNLDNMITTPTGVASTVNILSGRSAPYTGVLNAPLA